MLIYIESESSSPSSLTATEVTAFGKPCPMVASAFRVALLARLGKTISWDDWKRNNATVVFQQGKAWKHVVQNESMKLKGPWTMRFRHGQGWKRVSFESNGTWMDMDGHGWTWINMDGHGSTWMDMDGHGWTWMDMAIRCNSWKLLWAVLKPCEKWCCRHASRFLDVGPASEPKWAAKIQSRG